MARRDSRSPPRLAPSAPGEAEQPFCVVVPQGFHNCTQGTRHRALQPTPPLPPLVPKASAFFWVHGLARAAMRELRADPGPSGKDAVIEAARDLLTEFFAQRWSHKVLVIQYKRVSACSNACPALVGGWPTGVRRPPPRGSSQLALCTPPPLAGVPPPRPTTDNRYYVQLGSGMSEAALCAAACAALGAKGFSVIDVNSAWLPGVSHLGRSLADRSMLLATLTHPLLPPVPSRAGLSAGKMREQILLLRDGTMWARAVMSMAVDDASRKATGYGQWAMLAAVVAGVLATLSFC